MRKGTLIPAVIAAAAISAVAAACGGSGGTGGQAAGQQTPAAPAAESAAKLAIQHVEPGCHLWSNGQQRLATMELTLAQGGTLTLFNNDVDTHELVQTSGPGLTLPTPMMTGGQATLAFPTAGVFTFETQVVEEEGELVEHGAAEEGEMAMESAEEEADHELRLVVRVA